MGHPKNTQENGRSRMSDYLIAKKQKVCPGNFFGPGHIRLLLGGVPSHGFLGPRPGKDRTHPELFILAPQGGFGGRMSRVLRYLEGGRGMFRSLAKPIQSNTIQAKPSQKANWGRRLGAKRKSTSHCLLAIPPAFDCIAWLYNRHLNSNRGICLRQ